MTTPASPQITVYSATWCGFCHAAKQYFDKLGVAYTDKDVESDQAYMQESVDKSGQMGIPVIDIAGDIVVGFDRARIDTILKSKQLI